MELISIWPIAFGILVIFITILLILLHLIYNRVSDANSLLTATLASKSLLLQSNERLTEELLKSTDRETKLQKSIDNILKHRDDLITCLALAKTDEEKRTCILRIAEVEP